MRILLVTLMHRQLSLAQASIEIALSQLAAAHPQVVVDRLLMYGDAPYPDGYANVAHKYRRAQTIFMAGEWDVFMVIEDDMVIQPDAFIRLLGLLRDGADIGYGLYVWRRTPHLWSAYSTVLEQGGTSYSERADLARQAWGQVRTVAGVGMGCTAIKRAVLQRLAMRRGGAACTDWYLSLDAQQAGFVQRCDLGLVCGHIAPEDGVIYWPDVETAGLWRAEPIQGVESWAIE